MTASEIAECYDAESARDFSRDLKVMVVSVMECALCSKYDAVEFLHYMLGNLPADMDMEG